MLAPPASVHSCKARPLGALCQPVCQPQNVALRCHTPLQGPRLVDALEFLVGLLHDKPELIPAGFPFERLPAAQ